MSSSTMEHRDARRSVLAALAFDVVIVLAGGAQTPTEFMTYDEVARSVQLTVVARYDESNSGFNLNGGSGGSHRITVPTGWRVQVAFVNRDVIEHSLGVVRETKLLPIRIEKPAFVGAASRAIMHGIPAKTHDDFAFVAAQAGPYLLACGVPGHAAVGSYLRFVISPTATVPTYESGATIASSHARN